MRETIKFNLWAKYFSDKTDRLCYGNGTQSAIKAYGYDIPRQYHLASVVGSKNMRKYESLASMICEQEGFSFSELMKIGLKKMLDGNFKDWEQMMVRLGYFVPEKQLTTVNTQVATYDFSNLASDIAKSRKERGLPSL
ncbi:MAG: hypothetical protein A2355_07965 [Spirochaetes bacterium RIFOXYB1_FULL_32_8]|nr:MAG: hypothetical protein A2355_07965 [Spirochaetes bacterium RIFOXYB1_FULL_32_8]